MRIKCKLCKSVKCPSWETKNFFSVKCNKHFVPMIVLKDHKKYLSEEEKIELKSLLIEKHPTLFLDDSISDSNEHWHIHLGKKNKGVAL